MSRPAPGTMLMWAAGLVIATAVVVGILATGSPRQQRLFRLDAVRTSHLASLQHAVQSFHERQGRLPSSLAEVDAQPGIGLELLDPGDHPPYRYRALDADRFELCAVFDTDTAARPRHLPPDDGWAHGIGEQCFALDARPHGRRADDSAMIDAD